MRALKWQLFVVLMFLVFSGLNYTAYSRHLNAN